jgi:NAD(P)-dependent dehydrogenase (short-subunit alcohol dehydrogenase family)
MKESTARFRDQHILVTGAGTGIGRAIALRLAREGARLTLCARRRDRLQASAGEIVNEGGTKPLVLELDIRQRASVDRCFAEAAELHGPLHALVANSGIGGANTPGDGDRFDDLVATNLTGTYSCLRAAERHLANGVSAHRAEPSGARPIADRSGERNVAEDSGARHLVVVSSILARIGVPGYTGYCASKAGLLGLVRALACELAPKNVQVNAVLPGWVNTEMASEGLEGMARAMSTSVDQARAIAMQAVPLGRMSEPEDVAGLVAWLISPDARGVTGQGIDMNGGAFMI